jgi:hypothetical protein
VVSYYKQVKRIAHFVDDLKSDRFAGLSSDRKIEMYLDYLRMIVWALEQSDQAEHALRASLGPAQPPLNNRASGRQSGSGSASAGASTSARSPSADI